MYAIRSYYGHRHVHKASISSHQPESGLRLSHISCIFYRKGCIILFSAFIHIWIRCLYVIAFKNPEPKLETRCFWNILVFYNTVGGVEYYSDCRRYFRTPDLSAEYRGIFSNINHRLFSRYVITSYSIHYTKLYDFTDKKDKS